MTSTTFAAMERMNMDENVMNPADTDRMDELGFVTWASSDEDGGPDVGITVGLGPEIGHLWLGEIARARFESEACDQYADNDMGWWLMHYKPDDEPLVIGKLLSDDYAAREFFENTLAPLLRRPVITAALSTAPVSPRAREANNEQSGWVIERGDSDVSRPFYWGGCCGWTYDNLCAVRFARKEDAESVDTTFKWERERKKYPPHNNRIAEHGWS